MFFIIFFFQKNLPCSNKRFLIAVKACTSTIGQGIRGMPSVLPLETMALVAAFYKKVEKERELGFFTASFTPMKYHSEVQELIKEIGHNAAPVSIVTIGTGHGRWFNTLHAG